MATITDEFEIPSSLGTSDEDEIHERMLENISDEFDKSEGQVIYDLTRPTANVASRIIGYEIPEALKLIWPRFADGIHLDYHAETRHMTRRKATYASGWLSIKAKIGTVIPKGSIFSTESKNGHPSLDFETLEDVTFNGTGVYDDYVMGPFIYDENGEPTNVPEDATEICYFIKAQAKEAGANSNTGSNQIIVKSNEIDDISFVTNDVPFTGGYDEEDDETLKKRILEFDKSKNFSNIGNKSDYERWAKEVSGVGVVTVLDAEEMKSVDTNYNVGISMLDIEGKAASDALCKAVYDHIMGTGNEDNRLAPINVFLKVFPTYTIDIAIKVGAFDYDGNEFEPTDNELATIEKAINDYLPEASEKGVLRYNKILSYIMDCERIENIEYLEFIVSGSYKEEDISLINNGIHYLPIITGINFEIPL